MVAMGAVRESVSSQFGEHAFKCLGGIRESKSISKEPESHDLHNNKDASLYCHGWPTSDEQRATNSERRATRYDQRATSDDLRATSDERRATSDERRSSVAARLSPTSDRRPVVRGTLVVCAWCVSLSLGNLSRITFTSWTGKYST